MGLLPKETGFFDQFEKHAALTVDGARLFRELLDDLHAAEPRARRIKEVEHEADTVTHQTVEMLHRTFITPFDRHDIFRLIGRMDDILDDIESVAQRILLYEVKVSRPEAADLADTLIRATEQLVIAVGGLRHFKKEEERIRRACVDVNRLENEADVYANRALAKLFREEKDPLQVIKWKEIFETLEHATDRCEDVANIIEGVVLENA